ncbi:MAG: arginase family protein [Bacteroidia bacterium]|nr:arginase family protein [Bacteroidia bacterium]MDW8088700.1 arginase family protein [Bacteroidia bacterium]
MAPAKVASPKPIFGRAATWAEAPLVLIAVPWEGGVSFRRGTAQAPELIRQVSAQIDYYRSESPAITQLPIHWVEPPWDFPASAEKAYETTVLPYVMERVRQAVEAGKVWGLVGGDHSIALGGHYVLDQIAPGYGLLHLDGHADLRPTYEGNPYSHATILYHAAHLKGIESLVAVGIRDWAAEEAQLAQQLAPRLTLFEMRRLRHALYHGRTWAELVGEILSPLPERVYVSLDVDVLEPGYVPHTGTPVPGGFQYEEVFFLLEAIVRSGRKIIAFDVCETGGMELDAIIAAHLLYRLCALAIGLA